MAKPCKQQLTPVGNLERGALVAARDAVGRFHFRPHASTPLQAKAFKTIQTRILKGSISFASPLQQMVAHLILLDGIATRQDLPVALIAACHAYCWRDAICIEWSRTDGRQDRRFLSPLTSKFLGDMPDSLTPGEAMATLRETAALLYPRHADPVGTLFSQAQAWLFESLPGALFAHVAGTNPLTALPRHVLARESSELPLRPTAASEEMSDGVKALGLAFDTYFEGPLRSGSGWLIDRVVAITRRNKNLQEHIDKRRMLGQCLEIAWQAGEGDGISALVLAWATDLVESGTLREPDLHPTTIEKYVRLGAPALRSIFVEVDIGTLDAAGFDARYKEALEATSAGERGILASALAAWHQFLIRWLDAPPLTHRLHRDAEILPAANLIWTHEQSRLVNWLETAILDERLLGQVKTAFAISTAARIRAGELFTLRLRSIRIYGDALEIEICPLLRDGSLKTPSARRVLTIIDPNHVREIIAWAERRRAESAIGEDLLFGDPHAAHKVYREGQMYVLINRLLRAVTGDDGVSLHTLSHTWISNQIHDALTDRQASPINPLDAIGVDAGHSTVQTGLTHYFHRFELPLRLYLDSALEQLPLTSSDAARLSGVSADALRQRKRIAGIASTKVYWQAIRDRGHAIVLPDVKEGIVLAQPDKPAWLDQIPPLRFGTVLKACGDLVDGLPEGAVASRCGQSSAWVSQLVLAASEILRDLSIVPMPKIAGKMAATMAIRVLRSLNDNVRAGIDFRRIGQVKFQPLVAYLERTPTAGASFQAAASAWRRSYRGRHLSLEDTEDALGLAGLLQAAGVPVEQLAISVAARDPKRPDIEELAREAAVAQAFLTCYRIAPLTDWKKPRRGRPSCYLLWSSTPLQADTCPAEAATSLSGFNALMLAAWVFAAMVSPDHRSGTSGAHS